MQKLQLPADPPSGSCSPCGVCSRRQQPQQASAHNPHPHAAHPAASERAQHAPGGQHTQAGCCSARPRAHPAGLAAGTAGAGKLPSQAAAPASGAFPWLLSRAARSVPCTQAFPWTQQTVTMPRGVRSCLCTQTGRLAGMGLSCQSHAQPGADPRHAHRGAPGSGTPVGVAGAQRAGRAARPHTAGRTALRGPDTSSATMASAHRQLHQQPEPEPYNIQGHIHRVGWHPRWHAAATAAVVRSRQQLSAARCLAWSRVGRGLPRSLPGSSLLAGQPVKPPAQQRPQQGRQPSVWAPACNGRRVCGSDVVGCSCQTCANRQQAPATSHAGPCPTGAWAVACAKLPACPRLQAG